MVSPILYSWLLQTTKTARSTVLTTRLYQRVRKRISAFWGVILHAVRVHINLLSRGHSTPSRRQSAPASLHKQGIPSFIHRQSTIDLSLIHFWTIVDPLLLHHWSSVDITCFTSLAGTTVKRLQSSMVIKLPSPIQNVEFDVYMHIHICPHIQSCTTNSTLFWYVIHCILPLRH